MVKHPPKILAHKEKATTTIPKYIHALDDNLNLYQKVLHTLDPLKLEWADYVSVKAECGNLSGNKLTCNSSGNTRPQSSQLAEPPWTDPDLKSGISLRKLISTLKKKKVQAGNELSTFSPNPCT